MKKITYSLTLAIIAGMVLASCSLFGDTTNNGESAMPEIQFTATAPVNSVTVELSAQVDTSIQYNAVGQVMRFKYVVKVTKNDLTETLPPNVTFSGATPICPAVNTIGNANDRFDAGESLECTFDYLLTQTDLDKGSVSNVATVSVYGVNSNTITTNVPTVQSKLISLAVTANPTTYSAAGQTITFSYAIKNGGAAPLGPGQFTVTDTLISGTPFNCGNADATIAPGAELTCTSTYTVNATDVTNASFKNNATASGSGATSQPASVTVSKTTISSGTNVQHTVAEGEWLWQISRCYGADPKKTVEANKQLANPAQIKAGMVVTVPNIGSNGKVYISQQSPKCVEIYTVQSGDTWSSIATKFGADTALLQMVNANTLTPGNKIKVPLYTAGLNPTPSTGLSLTVTASPTNYSQAGQAITFTYVIKNNTSASLGPAQFTVLDTLISASTAFNCGAANTTLAPGATVTCTSTYNTTATDASAASVISNALAAGGGAPNSPAVKTTVTKGTSQLSLSVTANPTTYSQVGQIITLTYVIKNDGSTNLGPTQFTVTDPLIGASSFNCGPANTTLAPAATTNCNVNYTITQVDMNSASVSTKPMAGGGGVPQSAPVNVSIVKSVSSISLTSSPSPTNYNQVGQTITFNYVITNNGTATLGPAQFTVTDILISPNPFNCGAANFTLAPGATVTCSNTYTISQADMGVASISNSATASGGGASTTQPDIKTVIKQ